MNTVYICRCAATWDGSQINTFLLLATPSPPPPHSVLHLLLPRHLLSPLCSPFSRFPRPNPPFSPSLSSPSHPQIPTVTSSPSVTSLTSHPLRFRPRDRLCRRRSEFATSEHEFSGIIPRVANSREQLGGRDRDRSRPFRTSRAGSRGRRERDGQIRAFNHNFSQSSFPMRQREEKRTVPGIVGYVIQRELLPERHNDGGGGGGGGGKGGRIDFHSSNFQ